METTVNIKLLKLPRTEGIKTVTITEVSFSFSPKHIIMYEYNASNNEINNKSLPSAEYVTHLEIIKQNSYLKNQKRKTNFK